MISDRQAQRLHQALTATGDRLFQLLQEQDPAILRNLLKNPHLNEQHLLSLLKRRDLQEELLKALSRHELVKTSHQLKVALAGNPQSPAQVVLPLLPHLYLFELLNLCILSGPSPDQRLAAERQIIQRLSTIELGQKLTLARRGTANILAELIKQGESRVLQAALDNPQLKEVALLNYLRSGRADAETISSIARHSRWQQRQNLRLAILRHRSTPAVWFTLWLRRMKKHELAQLRQAKQLTATQKSLVAAELKKRTGRD